MLRYISISFLATIGLGTVTLCNILCDTVTLKKNEFFVGI